MICEVTDKYTKKYQDVLGDNQAAAKAHAWANINLHGDTDVKLKNGLRLLNTWSKSNVNSKSDANKLLYKMQVSGLINRVGNGEGFHFTTDYPEIVSRLISNKTKYIFSGFGNISASYATPDHYYLYARKNPLVPNATYAASFDEFNKKDINKIGEGMLGTSLMSLDGIVKIDKQNETVNVISEKIAREVLAGNDMSKQDVDAIINDYYNEFSEWSKELEDGSNDKLKEHLDSYTNLKNWENLRGMIYNQLQARSGIVFKDGVKSSDLNKQVQNDDTEISKNNDDLELDGADKAQGNFADNFAITLDSKAGLSARLKMFMSTLPNGKKHYLTGEDLFENFDVAYNTINGMLAGTEPNFAQMISVLNEFKDEQWISSLINKLQEANRPESNNQSIVKEFITAMNKHYINMSFVNWINNEAGYQMKIMDDNSNSRRRVIMNDWSMNFSRSPIVFTDENHNQMLDKDAASDSMELIDNLFKDRPSRTTENIIKAFKSVGISLSERPVKDILDGKFTINGKKISSNAFFDKNHESSPLKYIYKSLSVIANSNNDLELGKESADVFRNGTVQELASLESKYSKHLYPNSFRSGSKTIFSYTNDKFIVDRMYELLRGYKTGDKDKFTLLNELSTDIYAKNSYWLNQLKQAVPDSDNFDTTFSDIFEFGYLSLDALKKQRSESSDRSLADMSSKEIIAIKLAHLLNMGTLSNGRRVGKLFYPTMSDKTTMLTIQSLMYEGVRYNEVGGRKSIDNNTVDFIYNNVVKSEMNRMWSLQKQTNNYSTGTNVDSYDDGAKYFYTIPALNGIKGLWDFDTVPGKRLLKSEELIDPETKDLINKTITNSLNSMIALQIQEFEENGIGYSIDDKGKESLEFMDKDGMTNITNNYVNPSMKDKSDAIAADYAINYFIHNANVSQLFHGDYAQYFKAKGAKEAIKTFEELIKLENVSNLSLLHTLVKPTFDNLGKRLAADLAPGYEADFGDKTQLRVTVSNDREINSQSKEYIDNIFKNDKEARDSWTHFNSSDAQSWSSLDFHIDTLFNFGNKLISEKDYKHLKQKIADAREAKEDVEFDQDELTLVLQPTKPIYSNNKQQTISKDNEAKESIGVRKYIKTSSFPLIPQLVKGSDLEHVMRAMDAGRVDMHVFESGFKVGMNSEHFDTSGGEAQSKKLSIFNKEDGSMNYDNVAKLGLEENVMSLDIRGFKIQQEVPYHDHPGDVNRGTQESKLLFSNIKGLTGFNYGSEKDISGERLEQVYNEKYKQLYSEAADKLKKELYKNGKLDFEKVQKLFQEEANGRNYSINDKLGLALNERKDAFNFPLWALPAAHKYESMLISIVDNRVRKLKIPGNSFVLGSEAGFTFKKQVLSGQQGSDKIKEFQDSIIFTSNFEESHKRDNKGDLILDENGNKILSGEYKLQSYRENGEGMKPSQVFVPNKLKGENGEFIDLMKYTYRKDGKLFLDESRLPKDLLKMFGFRIPTQGHNSMAALEIAGFLPAACGDLIIASQDLVVQMGSDFDVDKLYTYMYSTKEILRDKGQFKRIKEIKSRLKELNSLLEDDSNEEDYSSKEKMQEFLNSLAPVLDEEISLKRELQNLDNQLEILRQNPANFKIVRDNKKSLYNDLLDIHLSVFDNNNPELYKLILSPNGFGQLKTGNGGGLAAEIDALKTKAGRPQYNYLSPQYQMMKFFNGVSGKSGVGVTSSLAMLNAITQNKGLKYVHTNEESQDIFHVKFGGIESDGSIGLLKTLNNSDYTSKVIEAFQSASVDNEKEQILYKLNINKHTFNAINALSLLGFDESVICYFINQPIVEEYVKRASEKDSSLRKFEESLTGDIYGDLIQEFSDKYKTKPDYTATDYGVEDLKKQIETPERDNNETKQRGRDSEFWGKQLALLEKFKSIDDIGLNLQSLMQTVNAESKGLGKTLFGSLDRAEKIDNIDSVTDRYGIDSVKGVLNAGRILYDYDKETGEYILDKFHSKQTNSLNGFVAEYGTTELNRIGEQLLPYNNKTIKSIFGYTSSVLDRKGNSINSNEEFMSETFTKMKSYLFSNTELFGERFDILNERKRLFLGTSKFIDGKLQVENPSLPEIIAALKTDENGIANTNALLRQLVPDTRRKSSDMDLLKYTASTGQNLDESELHQAFIALFRESPVLEFKIGNKLHSIDGRTLAEDLIKYVYLSGGTQEAIQFTRYIPIEVLNYMGFSDKLKTIADGFSPSIFGVSLDEKGKVVDSNITEQILQHNPSKVPVKIKGKLIKSNKDNTESGIEDVKTSKNSKGVDVITEFKLILDKDETKSRGEYMNGQKYLSGRLGDSYLIYKKFGDTYQLIPTLGSFGVDEYNYNIPAGQIAKSIISDRNIGLKDDIVSVEGNLKDSQKIAIEEFNSNKVYNFNKIPEGKSHIEWSLNSILNNKESSDYHKSIAKALVENDHILKTLSHIPISYSGISAKGKFKFSDDLNDKSTDAIEISDNPKVIINQDYLDRSILHEIQHAYTVKTLRRFDAGDKTLPENVIEAAKRIDTLRRSLRYKFKQNSEFLKSWNKVANYLDPNKANSEQLSLKDTVTYGLMSNEEFVTMATEDPEFRRLVTDAGNGFLNDSNIFTKLWNALLDFLGLNSLSQINKDYVTNEIFKFINTVDDSLNPNIEKSKLNEGFQDNEKLRKVEEVLNEIEKIPSETEYSFSYKGKSIPTEFQLTNGQEAALRRLIDFIEDGKTDKVDNAMTLQGYAGTGKTTIIGYLQKYFGNNATFVYMAPTHAATVELSMATSKTGNRSLAMTVASGFKEVRDFATMISKKVPSKKLDDRLNFFNNVLIIDEVSMLSKKDYQTIKEVVESRYKEIKVIFMGDIMQIPEVDTNNPDKKPVSLAFSEFENVELKEVKRTSDVGILNVLTAIRNQKSDKIPTIPNTGTIEYLPQNEFDRKIHEVFKDSSENTVMISYTNAGAKGHNKRIRQSLGRNGNLTEGDIIVGFGGYNSKQVENGDIANSIRYIVDKAEVNKTKDAVIVDVTATSKRLEKLKDLGVNVPEIGKMKYLQLSTSDSFVFDSISRDDMDLNNKFLSEKFEKVLNAKNAALADKRNWPMFFRAVDELSIIMSKYNVGNDYVYNPKTKSMELYYFNSHSQILKTNPEMKVEKGVDYGHAITIHKSQGSTVENVFFDSSTLPRGSSSILINGENVVGSEKKSLIYVALSRASQKLYINKVDGNLFYDLLNGIENLTDNIVENPKESSIFAKSDKINIYAGANENSDLSNFAIRPFIIGGEKFNSVEQYFQLQKFRDASVLNIKTQEQFDRAQQIMDKIHSSKNSAEIKRLGGTRIPGVSMNESYWDKAGKIAMKIAIEESFKQNPIALNRLISTGNVELTHIQDKSKWGIEFPKLLMEVRSELSNKNVQLPSFESENINFELSLEEQELLIKKHGKNAVEDYNELTNEEKEYIIKCL